MGTDSSFDMGVVDRHSTITFKFAKTGAQLRVQGEKRIVELAAVLKEKTDAAYKLAKEQLGKIEDLADVEIDAYFSNSKSTNADRIMTLRSDARLIKDAIERIQLVCRNVDDQRSYDLFYSDMTQMGF